MKLYPTVCAILLAASMAACTMDLDSVRAGSEVDSVNPSEGDWFTQGGNLTLSAGHLAGAVGPVVGLDHEATQLSGWTDGYLSSVEVVVETDHGAAMTVFDIWGSFADEQLQRAEGVTVRGYEDASGLGISVLGCAGPAVGDWPFDVPADQVTVRATPLSPGTGAYRVEFTAEFGGFEYSFGDDSVEPTSVHGAFVVQVGE